MPEVFTCCLYKFCRDGVGNSVPHVVGMKRYNNSQPFSVDNGEEAFDSEGAWLL